MHRRCCCCCLRRELGYVVISVCGWIGAGPSGLCRQRIYRARESSSGTARQHQRMVIARRVREVDVGVVAGSGGLAELSR